MFSSPSYDWIAIAQLIVETLTLIIVAKNYFDSR